jgi:hypothetical protein
MPYCNRLKISRVAPIHLAGENRRPSGEQSERHSQTKPGKKAVSEVSEG